MQGLIISVLIVRLDFISRELRYVLIRIAISTELPTYCALVTRLVQTYTPPGGHLVVLLLLPIILASSL